MDKTYKILLVDDEPDILEFLSYNLKNDGYDVFTVNNGKDAVKIARETIPHLVLLDIMMPGMDGIETCERIREFPNLEETIIVFLTARGEDYSQIAGFKAGGDDYIMKPINPKVLISKLKALLKRSNRNIEKSSFRNELVFKRGNIIIDKERYIVTHKNKELILPKKEFELLLLLFSKPGKVFTREEIFNTIWGEDVIVGDRTIDVHIRKLREKLEDKFIKTVKGVGYKFQEE